MPRAALSLALGLAGCAVLPTPASAEIVHLSTGRTLSVRSHRLEGDSTTLVLRAGGEITCPASLIVRIDADEVAPADAEIDTSLAAGHVDVRTTSRPAPTGPYAAMIAGAARRHNVDPHLVHAIIRVESNFQPRARSRRGARGLMQLMPETVRLYAVANPYDPAANIEAGTHHLRDLLDRLGLQEALAAYNAGLGAVRRHGGVPPFAETEAYVARVMRELALPPAIAPPTSNP